MNDTDWIMLNSAKHDLFTLRTMRKYAINPPLLRWAVWLDIRKMLRKVRGSE